jgi:hypothetical protein
VFSTYPSDPISHASVLRMVVTPFGCMPLAIHYTPLVSCSCWSTRLLLTMSFFGGSLTFCLRFHSQKRSSTCVTGPYSRTPAPHCCWWRASVATSRRLTHVQPGWCRWVAAGSGQADALACR